MKTINVLDGADVRAWRLERGFTAQQMATALDVSLVTWWRWERGFGIPVNLEDRLQMAERVIVAGPIAPVMAALTDNLSEADLLRARIAALEGEQTR